MFCIREYKFCDLMSLLKLERATSGGTGCDHRWRSDDLLQLISFGPGASSTLPQAEPLGMIRLATSRKLKLNNSIILMDLISHIAAVLLQNYILVSTVDIISLLL